MKVVEGKLVLEKEKKKKLEEILGKTKTYCKRQKKELEKLLGNGAKVHITMNIEYNPQGEN